jgi:hypothetical protein
LSHHPKTTGLGQVGNERGRGLYLQTVLAVRAESGQVMGCAMQEPFVRTPAPQGETRDQRRQRAPTGDGCLGAFGEAVGPLSARASRDSCWRSHRRPVRVF